MVEIRAGVSAGPNWKHFCGGPLSGVQKFLKGCIKVIIIGDIKRRGLKG